MRTFKNALKASALIGATLGGLSFAVPSVASADPPAEVGGLNLDGYCTSIGYAGVTLVKGGVEGPNFAYDNWQCVTANGATHPLSMEQACKAQWGVDPILAIASDPNNAYSWNCYSPGKAGS